MKEVQLNRKAALLEALEYIDRDLIAEVIDEIKAPDMKQTPERDKTITRKSIKYALLLAACLVLISAVIPVASYLITHFELFRAGSVGETTTECRIDIPEEHVNRAKYPLFVSDLEPISDEMIEELKDAWYQKVYSFEHDAWANYYSKSNLDEEGKLSSTDLAAKKSATFYRDILFSEEEKDHFIGRYYGTIGNSVIFALNTYLEGEYNVITIGNTKIENDNSIYILAYRNGEIKTLNDAYTADWLTDKNIKKIEERHKQFNAFAYWEKGRQPIYHYARFTPELEGLSYDTIEEINNYIFETKYAEQFSFSVENDRTYTNLYNDPRITREKLASEAYASAKSASKEFEIERREAEESQEQRSRYYGTFGGKIIWANCSDMEAETQFTFAGRDFYFVNVTDVNVYANGKIHSLDNAYKQGIITDSDIIKLHERYLAYEKYLDMLKDIGDQVGDIFIYGEFEGATVFGQVSQIAMYNEESVAGCVFKYSNGVGISVYKDGELYGLYKAYTDGILSAESIKDIWRWHEINVRGEDENFEDDYIYGDYLAPINDLEPLTKTSVDEINAEWAALYPEYPGKLIDTDKLNRGLNYRYFGNILGRNVIWVAGNGEAETKSIHGYDFSSSSSFDIIVCYSGSVRLIEEAFHLGMYERYTALIYERNKEYEEYFASHAKNEVEPIDIPKPTYPIFTPELEELTLKQMYEIRNEYANYCWLEVKPLLSDEELRAVHYAAWNDLFSADVEKFRYLGTIDDKAVFYVSKVFYGNKSGITMDGIYVYSFDRNEFSIIILNPLSEEGNAKLLQRIEEYNKYLGQLQLNQ